MKSDIKALVLILLFGMKLYSQTITVLSKENKKPVLFAHVVFKSLNSTGKEDVILTDTNGQTVIPLQLVNIKSLVEISCVGYAKVTDTLVPGLNKIYYLDPIDITMNEVVITAQYAPNSPEKSVHKLKIIDRKRIETQGAQNLRDLLTNEMNIRISQDNVLGSGMSLQGISGQNVKILIDGIPMLGRLNGNIDISQINLNDVERIEIVEGPLSVNYGTDALAGTINIITKKSQKETVSVSSNNYYESNGQYNFAGRVGYKKRENIVTLSGGRNFFDGWRTNDKAFHVEKERPADSLRYKNWKPKEQQFGMFYYGRYIKNLKFGYTSDFFYEKVTNKGLPRLPYYETAFDDYYRTYRFNNSLNLTGQLNKKYYTNVLVAYNNFKRIKNTYYKNLTNLGQVLTENPSDQDTTLFNSVVMRGSISTTKDSAKINYELGYDINHETGSGIRIKNAQQQIGDYAIFSSAEYKPFSSLTVRPGLRITYNTAYKAPVIPSVNVKYTFPKGEGRSGASIRFSYAKGFRAPSLKELYFYFVDINHNIKGNEELKAEHSDNFNLSSVWKKTKDQKVYKAEVSGFYNDIRNLMTLAQVTGTEYSYVNIGKYKTLGTNINAELAIKHLKYLIGASYIGRYNQLSETGNTATFSYSPEIRSNLLYEFKKIELTTAVFYKYTGKLPGFTVDAENNVLQTFVESYHTSDVSISKKIWKKRIVIAAGSKNIFDVKNVNGVTSGSAHSSGTNSIAIGMGRTYFFKLDININSK